MRNSDCKVSVIIPFYNKVEWLYDAVNSIDEEDNFNYEIIIVNDGSEEIIDVEMFNFKNKSRVSILRQKNSGSGRARNAGIEAAKGEYISFLDSDDLFVPNKLKIQYEFMISNGYMWSHTPYIKFFKNKEDEIVYNEFFKGDIFPYCFAYNPIATPTVMVKRKILDDKAIRFAEDMKVGQDGYMWSQLGLRYELGVVSEPLSKVRMRGTNTSLSAINHLNAKSKLYRYISKRNEYYLGRNISCYLKGLFWVCDKQFRFIEKFIKNNSFKKQISNLLYIFPYIGFKIYKNFNSPKFREKEIK